PGAPLARSWALAVPVIAGGPAAISDPACREVASRGCSANNKKASGGSMPKLGIVATVVATAALWFVTAPAPAQLARTFVSAATGGDLNNCDRPTPCRTFQRAHDQTLANGEISVRDPGGYGAVTITKAIGIINDGVGQAGVLVSGGGTG